METYITTTLSHLKGKKGKREKNKGKLHKGKIGTKNYKKTDSLT